MRVNRIAARRGAVLVAGAAASLACGTRHVPDAAGIDVRQYLGDARRSADLDEPIAADPRERWRASAGRGTLGAVALGDSVAVVAAVDRFVTALSTRDGKTYWRKRLDAPLAAGALVSGGRVYVGEQSATGHVVALRLRDGKRLWRRSVGGTTSPLLLRSGIVYGVSRSGTAFALSADDGRVRWERRLGGASLTGPIAVGQRLALVTVSDTLVVLDAATGRVEARHGLADGAVAPLARIDDSTVALASPRGSLSAIGLADGAPRWRVATGAPVFGSPVVVRDTVFALTNRCTLWAVPVAAPATADTLTLPDDAGERHLPCTTVAAPGITRSGVLVATIGGELLYVDRAARRIVWSRQLPGELRHPPALHNGLIVVAPLLGDVVSFR